MRKDQKTGLAFLASSPDDVEKTYLELKENGVNLTQELTATTRARHAILTDPDGNEFEMSGVTK